MRRLIAVSLALGFVLAACTDSSPPGARRPSGSPGPTVSETPTAPPPPPIAPLTGLVVSSGSILRRPALAVKIDNHTGARPHVGLERADVVYEEPVEGGITRFIAIYHSRDASKVGPVRSARLTDVDVLAEYGRPILAYSGAARYVNRGIARARLVPLRHGAFPAAYRRDSSRWVAPHNLFSGTSGLWRAARRYRTTPPPSLWDFGELTPPPPAPAPAVSPSASPTPVTAAWPRGRRAIIPFAGSAWRADWRYHSSSGTYLRWHGSSRHRTITGAQISAVNVIVMRVRTVRDNAGARSHGTPELDLVGSGEAVLLRNGVRIVGRWTRGSLRSPTVFTDAIGRPMVLAPGNTWVELVPTRIKPRYQ